MRLRDALDLCGEDHAHEWVRVPGGMNGRPATSMVAGLFDPGVADEPRTRPLTGHSLAVYAPDARLSLVWPVPEDDDYLGHRESHSPEWLETDTHEWKSARPGWAVILLGGAPIWQDLIWYLDWGSGIGGYVSNFSPVFGERDAGGTPSLERWDTTAWAVGLARLINTFSATGDFRTFDPTSRLVPQPSPLQPIDAERSGY